MSTSRSRSRWFSVLVVLGLALWFAVFPVQARAATPDYWIGAGVDPWLATDTVTLQYSATNSSPTPAPSTDVEFSVTVYGDPSRAREVLGRVTLPAIAPYEWIGGTATFPLPSWVPVGSMITLVLQSQINPDLAVPEDNTTNNINTAGFGAMLSGTVAPPSPPPTSGSTDSVSAVPQVARPGFLTPMNDPTFGSTITRITDPSTVPPHATKPSYGWAHEYSRFPGLNANGTKGIFMAMGGSASGYWYVTDVATGQPLYRIQPWGDPEFSWHPTNPNLAFYRWGNEARILHADTGQSELLMSFPEYGYVSTREEGRPSDNWHRWAFLGYARKADGSCCEWNVADLVVADLHRKRIIGKLPLTSLPDSVEISPRGNYVVAGFAEGTVAYKANRLEKSKSRVLFPSYAHMDFAIDAAGDEVMLYLPSSAAQIAQFDGKSGIASVRLSDGQRHMVMETGYWWASHISGIASREHPGWALISTYNQATDPQKPHGREIFWLALDGSGTVKPVAHHHSEMAYRQSAWGGQEKDYWAEPHASSTWDGKTIVFTSVWGDNFERYDVYTAQGAWWE